MLLRVLFETRSFLISFKKTLNYEADIFDFSFYYCLLECLCPGQYTNKEEAKENKPDRR
jgi:hypothetical protein